jgi:DNA polymerase
MRNSDGKDMDGLFVHLRYLSDLYPDLPVAKYFPSTGSLGKIGVSSLQDKRKNLEAKIDPAESLPIQTPARRSDALDSLAVKVSECRACPLGDSRTNPVFGEGNFNARLLFIGEGPGAEEDRTGRPFVGRAGELLDKMIVAMGLSREEVFIANAVKCRPPSNRTPALLEREACKHFLIEQIRIISPEAIVLLGQTAIFQVISNESAISSVRGVETLLQDFPGIRIMPTYHPAYLLRNPQAKAIVWKDLQQVMKWLDLPLPVLREK